MRDSVQLSFFKGLKIKKKRIRYKIPTYNRFYSIWQYNRDKFRYLINERKHGQNSLTQAEILEQCFIRENGKKLRDSDEKHIFRIGVLHRIHTEIYNKIEVDINTDNTLFYLILLILLSRQIELKIENLNIFVDEEQAEIINSWLLPIKDRVKLHIDYLRKIKREL